MELGLRILAFIQAILLQLSRPIFWYVYPNSVPRIPPIRNPLLELSAVKLAKRIREREVSSESVVEAYIERIKAVNPILNAVVEDRFEAALTDARTCDRKLDTGEVSADRLEAEQPLYGVPLTVKESCSLNGLSCSGCTLVRMGVKAHCDSVVVENLKKAGAIPLCVTNTPELCLAFETSNYIIGRTNNPYDARHTAGGSSGGEGALLGSGASLIGVGSDIAGSIRLPAHFNGVFGHKPTSGVIPTEGHFPYSNGVNFRNYLALGPMTRYAEDLALMVRVMGGKTVCDSLRLDDPVDVGKLHVHYMEDAGDSSALISTHEDVRRAIRKASGHLETCGASVKEESIEEMKDSLEVGLTLFFGMEEPPQMLIDPEDPKNQKNAFVEAGKAIFGLSQYTKSAILVKIASDVNVLISRSKLSQYKMENQALREIFVDMLGNDGVFLYPTFVKSAPMHNQMPLMIVGTIYCLIFNVLGLPSTHVPMCLDNNGLPIGLQVVAGPGQDRLCLAVARELEKGFGGWVPPTYS